AAGDEPGNRNPEQSPERYDRRSTRTAHRIVRRVALRRRGTQRIGDRPAAAGTVLRGLRGAGEWVRSGGAGLPGDVRIDRVLISCQLSAVSYQLFQGWASPDSEFSKADARGVRLRLS